MTARIWVRGQGSETMTHLPYTLTENELDAQLMVTVGFSSITLTLTPGSVLCVAGGGGGSGSAGELEAQLVGTFELAFTEATRTKFVTLNPPQARPITKVALTSSLSARCRHALSQSRTKFVTLGPPQARPITKSHQFPHPHPAAGMHALS